MGDRHVRCEPAPFVEQLEWPPAISFRGDCDVDDLVGLCAPAETVGPRNLAESPVGLVAVAMDAGGSDGDGDLAGGIVKCVRDRVSGCCGDVGVIACGAAHEYQPGAE